MKTKTINVYVTEEFIEKGLPYVCGQCPIALAMKNVLGEPVVIGVSFATVARFYPKNHTTLPKEAINFIANFDKGKLALPFNFQITMLV